MNEQVKPGETMSFEETWELLPYTGADSADAHTGFLQKWCGERE